METVYKMKFCDTENKRLLALHSINAFLKEEPKSKCCGYRYSDEGTIFVRRMKSGHVIAHWQK